MKRFDFALNFMVECRCDDEGFLLAIETLQRIGTERGNVLDQTCFILHRRGKFYIAHHKVLSLMDGEDVQISTSDIMVQNKVATLLHKWNIVDVVKLDQVTSHTNPFVTVVPHSKRGDYELNPLYSIGNQ